MQTNNKDNWLSTDFGLDEWGDYTAEEKLILYRQYVYEVGAVGEQGAIPANVVEPGKRNKYQYSRIERFRLRTRWFTDSGIIGSKEFVASKGELFNKLIGSKKKKIPRPISGISSVFSLKRLSEQ